MAGNHTTVALAILAIGMGSCAFEAREHAAPGVCDEVGPPGAAHLPPLKDFEVDADTPTRTLRMDIDHDGVLDELVAPGEPHLTVASNEPWSIFTGPEGCRQYRGSLWASEISAIEGQQALSVIVNGTNYIEEARYELVDGLYKPVSWRYEDFYDPLTGHLNHVPKWTPWGPQRPE